MQLELQDIGYSFDDEHWLFQQLSAKFTAGDMVALVGPSGSGKSTLLSIIAQWVTPRQGKILHREISTVGWVFQNPHGVARRTAIDHVVLPLLAHGNKRIEAETQGRKILECFHLAHIAEQPFSSLSGGEGQRLMLARAVAMGPDLLLVDEPTAQLDLISARTVNAVLGQLALDDTIVIVATHDIDTRNACRQTLDLADFLPSGVTR